MRFTIATSLTAAATVAIVVAIVRSIFANGSNRSVEVGSLSHQWIAEHRSDPDDTSR